MAYSTSPVTVDRMRPWLEPLTAGGEVRWRVSANRSRWLAYKIREALHAVRENPGLWPELEAVASGYKITVVSSREVLGVPEAKPTVEVEVSIPVQTAVHLEDVSVEAVCAAWVTRGDDNRLYYPNANLGAAELTALWEWAQREGVLIFELSGALTLTEWDEETAPFAWDPSDLESI